MITILEVKRMYSRMFGHTSRAEISATFPLSHLEYAPKQISFTSVPSSVSRMDAANTSQDTVDAVPLRIQRMPLMSENYTKQRQASVKNLPPSRTSSNYSPQPSGRDTDIGEENSYLEATERDKLLLSLPPSLFDYSTSLDQDPKSYNGFPTRNGKSKTLMATTPRFHSNGQRNEILKPTNGTKNTNTQCTTDRDTSPKRTTLMPTYRPTTANSTQQCEQDGYSNTTEVDLAARRQPKPFLKDASLDHNSERSEDNQNSDQRPQQSAVISTPPRTPLNQDCELPEYPTYCCDNTCTRLCIALLYWKTLCDRFSLWDISATIVSVAIFIFDVVTDLVLSLTYYHKIVENEDYRFFFGLTLGLVIGPSVIVQCFSFFWVYDDYRHKKERLKGERPDKENMQDLKYIIKLFLAFVLHLFQMAILFRYVRVLIYGFRSRYYEVNKKKGIWRHYDTLWRYEVHDLNMLRLLESFLESAPQLVLQLYIVFMTKQVEVITVISCVGSLLALSTMMVSIQRAIRNSNPKKNQLSIPASIVMLFWRIFTISSRVLAFALFLTIAPLAFLVFILLHWIVVTVWIAWKGTNFCTKKAAELFFNAICGLIYVFCFFNVHEEEEGKSSRSRLRMLIFYLVVLAENSICSILWYFFRPGGDTRPLNFQDLVDGIWQQDEKTSTPATFVPSKSAEIIQPAYALGIIVAVHVFFLLGMVFMTFYYSLLHPRRTDTACCFSEPKHQDRCRFNADECGTELVSAPAERLMLQNTPPLVAQSVSTPVTSSGAGISTHMMSQPPHSSAVQPGSSHSLQRRQKAQEMLRWRREHQMLVEAEGSGSDTSANMALWSETLFNRGKRAKKLYTRQYSREKELDHGNDVLQPAKTQTRRYIPRQTDRFEAVVTPTHEKRTSVKSPVSRSSTEIAGSSRHSYRATKMNPQPSAPLPMQSIVIRPGSRDPSPAPRSATHQVLNSCTLGSPTRKPVKNTPPPSLERRPNGYSDELNMPRQADSRGYSASMSCLVQEKPLSYVHPRRRARNREVPHTSSSTIQKDEIVEVMESSV